MISNLQILRALAAINVVFFHVLVWGKNWYGIDAHYLGYMRGWGESGVDVFFVMSGFLLVYSQARNPRGVWEFGVNRILRIAPLYWILTILFAVIDISSPGILTSAPTTPEFLLSSLGFLSRMTGHAYPLMIVGWTLDFEMFFYLVIALGILIVGHGKTYTVAAAIFLLFVAMNWADALIIEFLFGVLIGLLYVRDSNGKLARPLLVLGVALLFASIHISDEQWNSWRLIGAEYGLEASKNDLRLIIWGVPSALIVYGVVNLKQIKTRVLLFLGNCSYSIFLVQAIFLPLALRLFLPYTESLKVDIGSLLIVSFTIGVGVGTHYLMERPLALLAKRLQSIISKQPV